MKIERTLKRDNGDKIVITVEIRNTSSADAPLFDVSICVIPKGKRKPTVDTRSCWFSEGVFGWEWRTWDMDIRKEKTKEYKNDTCVEDVKYCQMILDGDHIA